MPLCIQLSADLYEEEEFFASTFDLDLSGGFAKEQNSKSSSEKTKQKVTRDQKVDSLCD